MVSVADRMTHLTPPPPYLSREEFVLRFDLVEWAFRKYQDYSEPERKGIPRDERRPVPKKKFMAQALMLTLGGWTLRNHKLLAQRIETSYTLERKWASEPEFKKAVRALLAEYLDGFFEVFLKMLKQLHELAPQREKTDSDLGLEAGNFYYLALMIHLADYTWGFTVQQRAHEKIQEALRANEIGYFSGFLKLLDLVCYARSQGKINVGPDYAIKCRDELDHIIQRIHWEECVAAYREVPLTVATFSAAQAYLSRLMTSRFCGLIAKGKQKQKIDTGAMTPLNTPTRYQALHLAHQVD
ncbi:MAG: hypothetical protein HY611_03590 [Elusimicrobia bacterium]|nr:hypothetical protein [Elusimicrobiota bacterium]